MLNKTWGKSAGVGESLAVPQTLDKAGMMASLLCAMHCALMPVLVTLLPFVGLAFLADERVEWALLAVSAIIGISSLCLGFREHRSRRAFVVLAVGLGLLTTGRIAEEYAAGPWAIVLAVAGGLVVAASHFINTRLCQSCDTCHTHL